MEFFGNLMAVPFYREFFGNKFCRMEGFAHVQPDPVAWNMEGAHPLCIPTHLGPFYREYFLSKTCAVANDRLIRGSNPFISKIKNSFSML